MNSDAVGIVFISIIFLLIGVMLQALASLTTLESTKTEQESKKKTWKPYHPKDFPKIPGKDTTCPNTTNVIQQEVIGERLVGAQGLVNLVERRYEGSSLTMYYVEKDKVALFSSPKHEVAEAYAEGYRAGKLGSGISDFLPKQP